MVIVDTDDEFDFLPIAILYLNAICYFIGIGMQ